MSDARLLLGSALTVPLAFTLFVLLPAGNPDVGLPMNLDAVVGLGGLLVLVLGPFVWGVAGCATIVALWSWRDLPRTDRRLHLLTIAALVGFFLVLTSDASESAIAWWLD